MLTNKQDNKDNKDGLMTGQRSFIIWLMDHEFSIYNSITGLSSLLTVIVYSMYLYELLCKG